MAEPERTDDGHYMIINGRRWRATDPAIPKQLRKELVAELMAARRAVRPDPDHARPRVQDAKVALGERGDPWWQQTETGQRERLAAAMRALLRHRAADSSICPSDAARVVGGTGWRELMDVARGVATELAGTGVLVFKQKGEVVQPAQAAGAIRLARGPKWTG